MTRKRDRLEVIRDILTVIKDQHNSIKPTRLLRRSNLSSTSFHDYYGELLAKGFVKEFIDAKGKKFVTLTDKGFNYLSRYQFIREFIEQFEL